MIEERTRLLVSTVQKLRSRGARQNIQRLLLKTHKADIGALLEALPEEESFEIFKLEPSLERRAEILSYVNQERQRALVARLDQAEVSRLLSQMDSDDAADLLGYLPDEEAHKILASMQREDSVEMADLMGYPEDSAGGLMSPDYLPFDKSLTVKQAVELIQGDQEKSLITFYLYVVNENNQLVGVASLRQLLLSRPQEHLKDIMSTSVISVRVDTPQEAVAQIVERYDFLSVPVVDETNHLMGVITVDDVIDVIREEAEEEILAMGQVGTEADVSVKEHFLSRWPWLTLSFLSGLAGFSIILQLGPSVFHDSANEGVAFFWRTAAFLPIIMNLGPLMGTQTATVVGGMLRSGPLEIARIRPVLIKEAKTGFLFSAIFSIILTAIGPWLLGDFILTLIFVSALSLTTLVSAALGAVVPIAFVRLGFSPTGTPLPVLTALANILGILILFSLSYAR